MTPTKWETTNGKKAFTPTQWRVMVAAEMTGDATMADIDSRRVRTRTIADLQHAGLLFSRTIEGRVSLTEKGKTAFGEQSF